MNRDEHPLTLIDALDAVPGPIHISTLRRWYSRGVRGIRLETVLIGGRRFTSHEATERFIAATTAAASLSKQDSVEEQLDLFSDHAVATGRGEDPNAAAESGPPPRCATRRRSRG